MELRQKAGPLTAHALDLPVTLYDPELPLEDDTPGFPFD